MNPIVSSLPGRLRLKSPKLRDVKLLALLEQSVADIPGVATTRGNAKAGSLVVHYNPSAFDTATFETQVSSVLQTPVVLTPAALTLTSTAQSASKYGAIGSLGISLAAAAAGLKALHVATGTAFLAFLGIHLLVHRQRLLAPFSRSASDA